MTTKILIAIHAGHSHLAVIERAKSIAEHHEIEVKLYSSIYETQNYLSSILYSGNSQSNEFRNSMISRQQSALKKIADDLNHIGISTEIEVDWRHPADQGIVEAAEDCDADMIIMSTRRHNQLSRLIMSNLDWEVLRAAKVPVLLAHGDSVKPYKTVLAAVDPTHMHDEPAALDEKILENATLIADWFKGDAHIGHAFPSEKTRMNVEYIPPQEETDRWRVQHKKAVADLAKKFDIPESRQHLLDEFPVTAIDDIAGEISADLVVIGVVSRGLFKRLLIGGTTELLIDSLECDILTTPPIHSDKISQNA